jgi:hypothetical protein
MKTSATFPIAACMIAAATATPMPLASGVQLLRRNEACGVHFAVFKTETCNPSCHTNDVLSIHEQISSPDDNGHVLVASKGGDLSSNFDLGSYFFQGQYQDRVLVTAKNTADPNDFTLHFAFGGDQWLSSDSRCTVGRYDPETQIIQGDCSFTCT